MSGTDALDIRRGTHLEQAGAWTNLHDDEMRRRAVQAAGEKDAGALLSLLDAYLTHRGAAGLLTSAHTRAAYRTGARQFLGYAEANAMNLLRPGRHAAQGYVAHLLAAGRAPAGVNLKVAAAGALYRALRWAGATEAQPFRDVIIPKDRTPGVVKRPPYTEEDLQDVLEVAGAHEKFLLFLLAHAGLRISEALALTWADLGDESRRIQVRSGKGRKGRVVGMSASLARAAHAYRALYGPGGPEHTPRRTPAEQVFRYAHVSTARHHLEKAFALAGVPFRGFHPGRKYAGTRLLQEIRDFGRVAAHLGHESIDTTRKGYAQLAADDLKENLDRW